MASSEVHWTEADIPDLSGRCALVTGANSGIGFETARMLAEHGARVLLACRNETKAEEAIRRIRHVAPRADVAFVPLDLASLSSVRVTAAQIAVEEPRLDLLINNAGVMALPRSETIDGFETQFAVNHLGHFALTGLLLPLLLSTPSARVVSVSSTAHLIGRLDFDNLQGERTYGRWRQYGLSKVSNLLFIYELQRRLSMAHATTIALAAHPGGSVTELARDAGVIMKTLNPLATRVMQSAAMGALPTVRAAVDPAAQGGHFYGPDHGMRGFPVEVRSNAYSHDTQVARKLWAASEYLTQVSFPW